MSLLKKLFGDQNEREVKKMWDIVGKINEFEPQFQNFNNQGLKDKTLEFKKRLNQGESKDEILSEAFALVREVAKRTLGQRHFDVQLIGGIALYQGKIAEMRTGEGKTLSATCPVYLNALDGRGVHVITVNDYLAKRDCVWMGQVYYALGLTVSCITHETAFIYDPFYTNPEASTGGQNLNDQDSKRDKMRDTIGVFKVEESYLRPVSRRQAYLADITYGTNNEFGFDYLRDNLVQDLDEVAQRELNYAIVDEVDSILIDEARTPLIISAPAEESANLYYKLARLVENLKTGQDYLIDEKMRAATLTEEGMNKIVSLLGQDPWADNNLDLVHHIEASLKAKTLFQKDRDYVIKDGEIIIVDEFTGRLMLGRRYSDGIHQAIEAKENVDVKKESNTLATITFQNYFRFYKKLAGMTGTALTEAEEFSKIYNLEVLTVPTNKPMIRLDNPDKIYRTKEAKFKAIIEEIKQFHEKGQPILIGTGGFSIGEQTVGAIEKNRIIKDLLGREGIDCQVLDATNHEKEGRIIAQAGRLGAVTVATNMAGRGVDIILGGNPPDTEEQKKVIELGGLHIIGTERHEARRIDNQLRGRAGRQGDNGSSRFFISLEDDLMRIFGGERLSSIMKGLNIPEDMPIESSVVSRSIEAAQKKIEGFNFDTRKHLLEYDDVLNKHRETVYRHRKNILEMNGENLRQEVLKMVKNEITKIINFHFQGEEKGKWDFQNVIEIIKNIFPLENTANGKIAEIIKKNDSHLCRNQIIEYFFDLADQDYDVLEKKVEATREKLDSSSQPGSLMVKIAKSILLQSIDHYWIDHLEIIDNLKSGIGLRAYGQQDPLVEYKKESFTKFNQLMDAVSKQVVYSIYKIGLVDSPKKLVSKEMKLSGPNVSLAPVRPKGQEKVGRNDPCPCGAKKPDGTPIKYKHCCGKDN